DLFVSRHGLTRILGTETLGHFLPRHITAYRAKGNSCVATCLFPLAWREKMKRHNKIVAPFLAAMIVISSAAVTQLLSQQGNEAPTGFDTPTLSENPGSQSKGNGLVDDGTFGGMQATFEEEDGIDKGLGPIYNA